VNLSKDIADGVISSAAGGPMPAGKRRRLPMALMIIGGALCWALVAWTMWIVF